MHHTRDLRFLIAHKERKLSRNVNCRKGFDVRLCALLLEGLSSLAVHVNVVDVNRRDDNFNIQNGKLGSLSNELSVDTNQTATVEVQPSAISSFLIGEEIGASSPANESSDAADRKTQPARCRSNQIDSCVQFSELMMRAGTIRNNFNARQTHRNMRAAMASISHGSRWAGLTSRESRALHNTQRQWWHRES
jgi:hypothetical protein